MKRTRILRILGIALILALLLAVLPATPALAAYDLTLVPTTGSIGNTITVIGSTFGGGATYILYLSDQLVTAGSSLQTVTTKKTVATAALGATDTGFTTTFAIPSKFDDNTDLTSGTYYVYACVAGASPYVVLNYTTLTVTGGTITLSPTTGPVGTAVQITGSNFSSGNTITATFAGAAVTIASGHTTVQTGGSFISVIYVPSSATVGAKTVSVTAGGQTASATFTVSASGSLDPISPSSGPVGTAIQIVGANFPASTAIQFKFGTTTLTPTGDTITRSNGVLISTITVPATATVGSHTITVTVGSQTATATFTVTASGSLDPISPTSGPAGTVVSISGGNFPASTAIVFKLGTTTLTPTSGDAATRASGIFISQITIPESAATGSHTITVTVGSQSDTATFTVTTTPTTTPPTTTPPTTTPLNVSASGDSVGAIVAISGSGFTPNGGVQIFYDGVELVDAAANADSTGVLVTSFQVPVSTHGDHTITAVDMNDADITAETTFTVESVAPDMPAPQLPLMGEKVSSPVSFDWDDVTDDSVPVTYQLQIASSSSFAESSILLDKIDLAISMYVMTEAEGLSLTAQSTPYYWRVRAVDAASNYSDWSGTGEFYIPVSGGAFPSWALYTIIGIGAVLVFGIGYWLGRRTAYYY
jgi:hypothetical protein